MQQIPTDLSREGVVEITTALRQLPADSFALYLKTKNFHWHMTGRHFRDYHLLLDEHGEQIFAMTDDITERARKIGGTTLRSIGDISRHQRFSRTCVRHRARNACPRGWTVCAKQQRKESRSGSPPCSTISKWIYFAKLLRAST